MKQIIIVRLKVYCIEKCDNDIWGFSRHKRCGSWRDRVWKRYSLDTFEKQSAGIAGGSCKWSMTSRQKWAAREWRWLPFDSRLEWRIPSYWDKFQLRSILIISNLLSGFSGFITKHVGHSAIDAVLFDSRLKAF